MERYLDHIIKSAERQVQHFLNTQVRDADRFDYGALKTEMIEPKPTVYVLAAGVSVYCNRNSRFYGSGKLLEAMNLAMDFVARCQRDNGSLDYPSCNFNSAADTSFCFKRLMGGYGVLEQYGTEETAVLRDKYLAVMRKALEMILAGGFHTPNHRWGITAALLQGVGLFKEEVSFAQSLTQRANEYLAEGIDGNDDGEYAERSTGNYNAVVNNAMMAMYEETGKTDFLGYVARNLDMMLTYIDPDDTIFTQNSTRQDQGKSDYADKYFYQYLYMASMTQKEDSPYHAYHDTFDAAAHKIIRDNMERGADAPQCLHIIMIHPDMEHYQFHGYGFPDTYRKYYQDAGVVRVKNPRYGYSVLKGKSSFLFMKVFHTLVYVKIGESIGTCRNFAADTLVVGDRECVLESQVSTSYYQPFSGLEAKDIPYFGDWWKMDHTKREILTNSSLKMKVVIREEEDGLVLKVSTEGLTRVPIRLQVCIPDGAVIENEHFHLPAKKDQWMILRDGYVTVRHGEQALNVGPGFGTHEFGGHYSGEEGNPAGFTIFMNEYSEFDKEIAIKLLPERV